MSRIAKMPVNLPQGVNATVAADAVTVKGAKGALTLKLADGLTVAQQDQSLVVVIAEGKATTERVAAAGAARATLANMVTGVSTGFTKTLNLVGTGYRAEAKGTTLNITIGYSHPVVFEAEGTISFATPNQTTIVVSSIDKQQVGNIAADIRAVRKPEPYHGKGIKYDTEVVRRKEGKTGKK